LRPLFFEAGLKVYSIAPLLALPPEIRIEVKNKGIMCQDAIRPDVILHRPQRDRVYLLMECKRSSFGVESSTATQAWTYLLLAGPSLDEALALNPAESKKALVVYLSASEQSKALQSTLSALVQELEHQAVAHGPFQCLGLEATDSGISLSMPDEMIQILKAHKSTPVEIMQVEPDTDPRPLYFIPYDPGIDQSIEERQLCRRILFERVHSYVLARIGHAAPPHRSIFSNEDLLNEATFGMYNLWEDASVRRHMRSLINSLLDAIHRSLTPDGKKAFYFDEGKGWVLSVSTTEVQEQLLTTLTRFQVEGIQPRDLRQLAMDDMSGN